MRNTTRQTIGKGGAGPIAPPGHPPAGHPRHGHAAAAWLGALLVAVLLLTIPLAALGQSAPLRDRGQADAPAPTATIRTFQPVESATSDEAASLGDSIRSRVTERSEQAPPSRRPRPDPAPVSLAPIATVAPEPEPVRARSGRPGGAPATIPRGGSARVWPLAPGSFEVSQPFGCVPQLHGFYPVVSGCPPEAPAVHDGIDFAADQGTPIYAAAAGWVTAAGLDRAGGGANTQIIIQHDGANEGYATEYFHWITTYVEGGDYVQAGEVIAEVGSVGYSTGPHLHFTVVDFATNERIDPARWLPATGQSGAYLGRLPGRSPVSFAPVNVPAPDYADPAPPPVPVPQQVPATAPAAPVADRQPASTDRPGPAEPTTAPVETADPAPAPTAHVNRADDAGTSTNDRGNGRRDRRSRDEAPEPTPQAPSFVPDAPLNPMVPTPVPTEEPDGGRKRNKKRDR